MSNYDIQETTTTVKSIIAEILKVDPSAVSLDSTFETLGVDSLDMLQIIMKLEDTFGIEISDDVAMSIKTVGQAIDLIQKSRTK